MTYLITGATGDVGAKVVACLLERGERPRLFVRDASKARSLFGDRADIVEGDLGNDASVRRALEGVDKLFLVNSGPQIPVRDEIAADAAKAAGVRHLVKLSTDRVHVESVGVGESNQSRKDRSFVYGRRQKSLHSLRRHRRRCDEGFDDT